MPTIDVLIEKYIAYRDHIQAKQAALDAELKPYKEAMAVFEGLASQQLGNAQSTKCEAGTVYRTSVMSAKVADRTALFDFVRSSASFDLLTAAVSKDAVKEYIDANGSPPPGVDVSYVHKCNFRRA